MEWITALFDQYGYMLLVAGLFAESIALPFPGELAMAVSGHMTTVGSHALPFVVFYSYIGAIAGTALSYWLGRKLGTPLLQTRGRFLFLTRERMDKMTKWFDRYGDKLVLVSYFIPGLRHFTGYAAGMMKMRMGTFFLYNCIGGLAWVLTYVMVGKLLGPRIEQLLHALSGYSLAAVALAALLAAAALYVKRRRRRADSAGDR